jgi:hypothetical protein
MLNRPYILLIVLSIILISCSQGIAIILTNKLKVDKKINVTFPGNLRFPNNIDSLQAWDLSRTENAISIRDRYRYSLKIPIIYLDTTGRVFSFNLKAGHEVTILSQPTSISTIRKTFIIDNIDTLNYKRNGGCWTYTVNK